MSDTPPDGNSSDCPVQNLQLGARNADNAQLAGALPAMADRINQDGSGGYAAAEWLGTMVNGCGWVYSRVKRATRWAVKRFTESEKQLAAAAKTRAEGRALERVADADAQKVEAEARTQNAKARQEEAKARAMEIKNELAEEYLRQIRERGIELAAEVRDGVLEVAVVKNEPLALPAAERPADEVKPKKRAKRTTPRKKQLPDSSAPGSGAVG